MHIILLNIEFSINKKLTIKMFQIKFLLFIILFVLQFIVIFGDRCQGKADNFCKNCTDNEICTKSNNNYKCLPYQPGYTCCSDGLCGKGKKCKNGFCTKIEPISCSCINNAIGMKRCPGNSNGYFSGCGNCHTYDNSLSGCSCGECSSCEDYTGTNNICRSVG